MTSFVVNLSSFVSASISEIASLFRSINFVFFIILFLCIRILEYIISFLRKEV